MKQLLILFLFLCSIGAFAQDVIVKKDGSTIVCRVIELTSSEITYKKWSDLNGSNYVMNRADASAINYQDGKRVNLSEATNLYAPGNQNDGVQQYNDKALLKMDATVNNSLNKYKILKKIGWIGGIALTGFGLVYGVICDGDDEQQSAGLAVIGAGVIWGAGFIVPASILENKEKKRLYSNSIYQHDFKLNDGSSIAASMDILQDKALGYNTIGLGLHYNF